MVKNKLLVLRSDKVKCAYCSKEYKRRGLSNHLNACKEKKDHDIKELLSSHKTRIEIKNPRIGNFVSWLQSELKIELESDQMQHVINIWESFTGEQKDIFYGKTKGKEYKKIGEVDLKEYDYSNTLSKFIFMNWLKLQICAVFNRSQRIEDFYGEIGKLWKELNNKQKNYITEKHNLPTWAEIAKGYSY